MHPCRVNRAASSALAFARRSVLARPDSRRAAALISIRTQSTASSDADAAAEQGIPLIDFGPFLDGDEATQRRVAREIGDACSTVGFLALRNHGVPPSAVAGVWDATRAFFDLDEATKQRGTAMVAEGGDDDYPYGYIPMGGETLSQGREQELDGAVAGDAPPDLNESFAIGPLVPGDAHPALGIPPVPALKWPDAAAAPGFEAAWSNYYREMEALAARLLRGCALALDLPAGWFDDKVDRHRSALRALNYPDLPDGWQPLPGQMRASAHTDYGGLTILLQEPAPGGLQVRAVRQGDTGDDGAEAQWVPVAAPDDLGAELVVNLGDLMRRWTNDRWASTLHRVVVPPPDRLGSCRRQSIAFFNNINPDFVVDSIPTCTDDTAGASRYEPIRAWDFLMEKHHAATGGKRGYLGDEEE